MTEKDRADLRLNCFFAAITSTGARDSSASTKLTTEEVLVEAKKISEWVIPKEEEPA